MGPFELTEEEKNSAVGEYYVGLVAQASTIEGREKWLKDVTQAFVYDYVQGSYESPEAAFAVLEPFFELWAKKGILDSALEREFRRGVEIYGREILAKGQDDKWRVAVTPWLARMFRSMIRNHYLKAMPAPPPDRQS